MSKFIIVKLDPESASESASESDSASKSDTELMTKLESYCDS